MRGLIARLRLARGLHWRGASPEAHELGLDATGVLYALLLAALLFTGQLIDQRNEARIEADRQIDRANLHQAALLACLNAQAPGLYTIDDRGVRHYIVCDRPFTVTDENLKG